MGAPSAPPGWDPEPSGGPRQHDLDDLDQTAHHGTPWKAPAVIGAVGLIAALVTGLVALRDTAPQTAEQPSPARSSVTATPEVLHEGWGVRPPTRAAVEAMWEWANASSGTLGTVTEVTYQVRPRVQEAMAAGDVEDIKFYCSQMLSPITVEMSGIVDTPDPDLTRALRSVVDSARDVESRCATLQDPPDRASLDALHGAFGDVAADLDAMVRIVDRDATIMEQTGR